MPGAIRQKIEFTWRKDVLIQILHVNLTGFCGKGNMLAGRQDIIY
jgi:hypothetical protein